MDVPVLWSIVQADLNELALESEAGGGGTVPMWMVFHLEPAQFREFQGCAICVMWTCPLTPLVSEKLHKKQQQDLGYPMFRECEEVGS